MIIATTTITRTFGIVAPTLTILQCLAQGNRIRTTGAKGVSLATWILSAFVSQIWFCYGLIFHVTAEVVANIPAITVSLVVAFLAARSQEKMARSVLGYLAVTVITVLATFAGSFHDLRWVLATVAIGSSIIIYLPQLALVIRPKDLSGVSIISWCLACLTSLGWLVYGILIHQPPLAIPSLVMLPSAFIIFVQASRHRIQNNPRTGLQAPIVE
jgi:uncharacterized protein with PQ loop repeat